MYQYLILIVNLVSPTSVFGVGFFFLMAPFPDHCYFYLFIPFTPHFYSIKLVCTEVYIFLLKNHLLIVGTLIQVHHFHPHKMLMFNVLSLLKTFSAKSRTESKVFC